MTLIYKHLFIKLIMFIYNNIKNSLKIMTLLNFRIIITIQFFLIQFFKICIICYKTNIEKLYNITFVIHFNLLF